MKLAAFSNRRWGAFAWIMLFIMVGTSEPGLAHAHSLDVTTALRLMRQAKAHLKAGNASESCETYQRVVDAFPTWWMSLVGRVRCGLALEEPTQNLNRLLDLAERYEAPRGIVAELRVGVLIAGGKLDELCKMLLPGAIKGKEVSLPLSDLLIYAWVRGNYEAVIPLVKRMKKEGGVSLAALRLGAEASLIVGDTQAADLLIPEFLAGFRDRVLLVRYIRDLNRRGRSEDALRWTEKWREWVSR